MSDVDSEFHRVMWQAMPPEAVAAVVEASSMIEAAVETMTPLEAAHFLEDVRQCLAESEEEIIEEIAREGLDD